MNVRFFKLSCFLAALLCIGSISDAHARQTVAFGILVNASGQPEFDYLASVFPTSFASTLKEEIDVEVVLPAAIDEKLKDSHDHSRVKYDINEIIEITQATNADIFVYGSYLPTADNNIKINLNIYFAQTGELFCFENTGRMETEIFKIVDRVISILTEEMSSLLFYKKGVVPQKSKMAIFTNLTGEDLNCFYAEFLTHGTGLSGVQANEIAPASSGVEQIEHFRLISLKKTSLSQTINPSAINFYSGAWVTKKNRQAQDRLKRGLVKYYYEYANKESDTIARLTKATGNTTDYILIVAFDDARKTAWIRCLDARTKDIIWMQSNVRGRNTKSTAIQSIAEEIELLMPMSGEDAFKKAMELE